MARPSLSLLDTLGNTIRKLEETSFYQWGHMGSCNCGFLAQQVTKLSREEIHRRAMMGSGDWTEQLNDYCPSSGLPMADMISKLMDAGFDVVDLQHLERLSDPAVLRRIPSRSVLRHNMKADVVTYFRAWRSLLEDQLLSAVSISELLTSPQSDSVEKSEAKVEERALD